MCITTILAKCCSFNKILDVQTSNNRDTLSDNPLFDSTSVKIGSLKTCFQIEHNWKKIIIALK